MLSLKKCRNNGGNFRQIGKHQCQLIRLNINWLANVSANLRVLQPYLHFMVNQDYIRYQVEQDLIRSFCLHALKAFF